MEWDDFKRGFERVHVNFDKRRRGPRYTDETAQARADHLQVADKGHNNMPDYILPYYKYTTLYYTIV